jgi:hypothetical protein
LYEAFACFPEAVGQERNVCIFLMAMLRFEQAAESGRVGK